MPKIKGKSILCFSLFFFVFFGLKTYGNETFSENELDKSPSAPQTNSITRANQTVYIVGNGEDCNGDPNCFTSIETALADIDQDTEIKIQWGYFAESLSMDQNHAITIAGGYDEAFNGVVSKSAFHSLSVKNGRVELADGSVLLKVDQNNAIIQNLFGDFLSKESASDEVNGDAIFIDQYVLEQGTATAVIVDEWNALTDIKSVFYDDGNDTGGYSEMNIEGHSVRLNFDELSNAPVLTDSPDNLLANENLRIKIEKSADEFSCEIPKDVIAQWSQGKGTLLTDGFEIDPAVVQDDPLIVWQFRDLRSLFEERFDDGDYTQDPIWTERNNDDKPGVISVENGELHIKRDVPYGNGGTAGIETETDIPVDWSTYIRFKVKPVYRNVSSGCGSSCGEYPINLDLYLEDGEQNEFILRFSFNYGSAVLDLQTDTLKRIASSVPQNAWSMFKYDIHDAWPEATVITKIFIFGNGWDYESYLDDLSIVDY